jgi:hypothetical protein
VSVRKSCSSQPTSYTLALANGAVPEDLANKVEPRYRVWIDSLGHDELGRLRDAGPKAFRAHIEGRAVITGVPPYEMRASSTLEPKSKIAEVVGDASAALALEERRYAP